MNEGEYRSRKLWKDIRPVPPTPSEGGGDKPSWMWRIVSAVFAKPFTLAEGANFGPDDVNLLIGRQLRLMVNQNPKEDKIYNNITDVLAVEKELEPVVADNVPSESVKPTTGYERAKAVASTLPGAKRSTTVETVSEDPTGGEMNPMVNDVSVEDIPF